MRPHTVAFLAYGGLHPALLRSWTLELSVSHAWRLHDEPGEAAVERVRDKVLTKALDEGQSDVVCMIDHDISWQPGDLSYLADTCADVGGLVGGWVSKRATGQGYGGRLPVGVRQEVRTKSLVELPAHSYMGGAFVAVHVQALADIARREPRLRDGTYPFTSQLYIDGPWGHERLTEDWALCHRIREAGHKVHASGWPLLGHHEGFRHWTIFEGCPEDRVQP